MAEHKAIIVEGDNNRYNEYERLILKRKTPNITIVERLYSADEAYASMKNDKDIVLLCVGGMELDRDSALSRMRPLLTGVTQDRAARR